MPSVQISLLVLLVKHFDISELMSSVKVLLSQYLFCSSKITSTDGFKTTFLQVFLWLYRPKRNRTEMPKYTHHFCFLEIYFKVPTVIFPSPMQLCQPQSEIGLFLISEKQ